MSKLYIVPTPVGNLEDITLRALRILKEVALILAEDTRTTGILLKHFGISARMQSYHKFNEHGKTTQIVELIKRGETIALVSDAGTPGISDPGFLIVREALKEGVKVETLPGATALIPALVSSGLSCDRFCFEGFLPRKKGRHTRLKELSTETRTMVFYESPHRVVKTLALFAEYFGADRRAAIAREISKMYEENIQDTLSGLIAHFSAHDPRGEFVIIVEGVK